MRSLVIVAVVVLGCGGGSPSPAASVPATPVASSAITTIGPSPTAQATPLVVSVDALIADPLPTADGPAILALDAYARMLASIEAKDTTKPDFGISGGSLGSSIWLCQATLKSASAEIRALEQFAGCVEAIAIQWQNYADSGGGWAPYLTGARLIYAYAVAQAFDGGRQRLDEALRAVIPESAAPSATPGSSRAHSIAELIGGRAKPTRLQVATSVEQALVHDFDSVPRIATAITFEEYNDRMAVRTVLDGCLYGSVLFEGDDRTLTCASIAVVEWRSYVRSGSEFAWNAAVVAFEFGYSLTDPRCDTDKGGCRAGYGDYVKKQIGP